MAAYFAPRQVTNLSNLVYLIDYFGGETLLWRYSSQPQTDTFKNCMASLQESFAKKCFALIDEYAPGFSSSVIGYDMLTPPDLEREIGLTGTS